MKFTFICAVTVFCGGSCIWGEVEIFPEPRYRDNVDYGDWYYPNPAASFNFEREYNRRLKNGFQLYRKNLVDPQSYGYLKDTEGDQDDFTFDDIVNDDEEEEEDKAKQYLSPPLDFHSKKLTDELRERWWNYMLRNSPKGKELLERLPDVTAEDSREEEDEYREEVEAQKPFENVKLVKDPDEFAYAPPDPRFYERGVYGKVPNRTKNPKDISVKYEVPKSKFRTVEEKDHKIEVTSRSKSNPQNDFALDDNYPAGTEKLKKDKDMDVIAVKAHSPVDSAGVYIIAIVAGISAAATVGLIAVGIGWYNLQKHAKYASDVEYPAYGVTGPNKDVSPSGDRRLAQSAQMYHYQHQKQQIIAMERAPASERQGSASEPDSDEENEEGDYTVYECPGLAPTGEMEVKNPLFQDDPTPAQGPFVKTINEKK